MTESNLSLPEVTRCAFCDYLSGRRPFTILCRSDRVAALVTREQRGVGHIIVVPVRHAPTLLDLSEDERHAIIDTVALVAKAIDEAFERPGIAVWQNNGTAAHQTIPHVHFHVAGTLPDGGTEFGEVPELTIDETDRIAAKIRAGSDHLC
ncbi:HIT family protein [Nocardia mangyaensis]|uniref:HIT family protein n=1 Tax=Nocardia mangyaensis TaxID=2213200 RepID=A0A1J0W1B9_9NOCA|nr:HIT family protein [Nocardia mangyaensis]APE38115.1 HIT family protein [Nocardia mangyaensis]